MGSPKGGRDKSKLDILTCINIVQSSPLLTRVADYVFTELHKALGSPGVLTIDMRPVSYVICIIFSHSIAEQLSRPSKLFRYSVHKSPTMHELDPAIGNSSILAAEVSHDWRRSDPFTLYQCGLVLVQPWFIGLPIFVPDWR
jgi:hypothetical protein